MKFRRSALFLSQLLISSIAFAGGPTYNWTVHNSNNYHQICAASGSACAMNGVAATWTLPEDITITRLEYESAGMIYQNANPDLAGPCPGLPSISVTSGTATYTLEIAGTGYGTASLYSGTGPVKWSFKEGTKLSLLSSFITYSRGGVARGGPCTTPPGNVVVSYTTD